MVEPEIAPRLPEHRSPLSREGLSFMSPCSEDRDSHFAHTGLFCLVFALELETVCGSDKRQEMEVVKLLILVLKIKYEGPVLCKSFQKCTGAEQLTLCDSPTLQFKAIFGIIFSKSDFCKIG